MNTETENNGAEGKKLSGAFGDRGTNVNAIAYGHPYADQIVKKAREVLLESKTGNILVRVMDQYKIPVQIIKGNGEAGYSPEMRTIYLQIPGKVTKANGEIILGLAKSLSEADQELGGKKRPDPMKDVVAYAGFMHARNLDSTTNICMIVNELTNSSYFPVLLDTLKHYGLYNMYRAFLDNASREQLYDLYAEAYETRGSK